MTVIYNELTDFVLGKNEVNRDVRDLVFELSNIPYEKQTDYVKQTIEYSLTNYGKIVSIFAVHLKGWTWSRIPLLTQAILIMSYAHNEIEKIDKKIIINIAVNLTKKYVEDKQAKFVNGILDEVIQ